MKKKLVAMLLVGAMACSMVTACGSDKKEEGKAEAPEEVSLNVVTTFAGNDGNSQNYKDAVAAFEEAEGIKVNDSSTTSDENFKSRIIADFDSNSEADVLFFFTGADASTFIEDGKVVSIEEIREEFPEYADNMDDAWLPKNLVDDNHYAVPVNGYWEGMFYNKTVLDAADVDVPGADYTWDAFLADCEKIKAAGYTPIAAALGNIPHYWWEYGIFNNTKMGTHTEIPASIDEGNGPAWVQGMKDIKELYDLGCFPENTLSATDDETFAGFTEGNSAFLIDGSWKVGGIVGACQSDPEDPATLDQAKLDNFGVTYIPAKSERKATDLIGGISSGYYISKKAWDDEAKRDAAVKFVSHMTTNELVAKFAQHAATALKETPKPDANTLNSLQVKAVEMVSNATSLTDAVQDLFAGECRVSTFDEMPLIVTGEVTAEDAVAAGLEIYAGMQ